MPNSAGENKKIAYTGGRKAVFFVFVGNVKKFWEKSVILCKKSCPGVSV